jgi:hypothetical protein
VTSKLLFCTWLSSDNDTGLGLSHSLAGTCLTLFLLPGSTRSWPSPYRPGMRQARGVGWRGEGIPALVSPANPCPSHSPRPSHSATSPLLPFLL